MCFYNGNKANPSTFPSLAVLRKSQVLSKHAGRQGENGRDSYTALHDSAAGLYPHWGASWAGLTVIRLSSGGWTQDQVAIQLRSNSSNKY